MARPHENTHSIKKLDNYMVGEGVKLNDVIYFQFHIEKPYIIIESYLCM